MSACMWVLSIVFRFILSEAAVHVFPALEDISYLYPLENGSNEIWNFRKILDNFVQSTVQKLTDHVSRTSIFLFSC